jgi:cytochrome oxidase Cu insertion factor (SCO1/SenC/PrrC family)
MSFGDTFTEAALGKVSVPEDTDNAPNVIAEGAAVNTTVGITAHSTFANGNASLDYSLSADSSGGGFKIDQNTGVVTVADPSKIDFESALGHVYTITVLATKNNNFSNSQTFTISVNDVTPSAPVDSNAAANTVLEGAANGTAVGITASSSDVNGGTVTYSLIGDTSGGGFTINATTGVVTVADGSKIDFESAPGHAYTVTVQSSDGTLTSSQAFTINVADVAFTVPADSNGAANSVAEGAVAGTTVGLTASASDPNGPPVTYSLIDDTSGGGFTINASTGVVTVADASKIDYESSAGHAYNVTVQAHSGAQVTQQTFSVAVTDVAPSVPTDGNAAANTVAEGAANGTVVGVTASSTDVNGPPVTYSLIDDTSGGGFTINASTGVVTVADASKIDYESSAGHAYNVTVQAHGGAQVTQQTFSVAVTDVAPSVPVDSNAAANTVLEGAANGTAVGLTASSTDVNGGAVTYTLIGDTSGGGFTIDATTGVVTVADGSKIDFESSAGHAYTVTVQSSDGTLTSSQAFTINVGDVPMTTPVDSNGVANSVAEGAAAGTTVGITASATDPSGPAATYSLIGDTSGGGFTVNASTGVVTVANPAKIDFESSAPGHTYNITVQASNGVQTTSQVFTVGITDVAPSAPTDSNGAANTVVEGAPNGTAVGVTASSTDVNGPAPTYSLVGDTSGGGFTINATTGVITVADSTKINFETAPGHVYTVTAQSSDGTLTNSQTFTIAVTDVAPTAPVDSNGATNTIAEGAANGSAVGVTAFSTDVNGPGVTYSLVGDTSGGGFTINSTTGVITVADGTKLDYETTPGHAYTVTAQASDGTLTNSQTFTIAVTDVAPTAPTDINGATNTVAEGAANGSTVGITASSVDPNGPATTYSLSDSAGGRFAINSSTGVVTVANGAAIDFETAAGHAYGITVLATNGALSTSSAFSIGVTDVAPSAPTDSNGAANTVVEGAANGTVVGITASSTDPGGGPTPTYTLSDNAGGRFAINSTTGVVTVANGAAIDFETAPGHAYGITVQATAGALSTTQNFTIAVSDVAPTAPVDSDGATNTVAEGAANGSAVGVTAFSTDVNGPGVTYSLVGDTSNGGFTINSTTGVITVADGTKLDYETTPSHAYTVTAQASDGTLTNSQTFTIALTDVAPSAPTDINGATNTVAEGAANGSTVGITASSVDPNGPATTYSLSDSAGGRFAINSSTGVVTVANGAAIDFETAAGHAYGITVLATNGALSTSSAFSIGVTDVAPSAPADINGAADSVFEGATNGTVVGITASSTDPGGGPVSTYTLTDSAGGRFAIDPTTGIVTVANGAAIDFETAPGPGHSYGITVQATAGALSSTHTFSIGIGDVNEAPAGTDKTVTMLEGDSYVFGVADFGFSDPSDSVNPNSLLAVKMTTVPGAGTGTFTNNGITVNAGDSVSATDIATGHLVFTPAAHSNGAPEASFTFQVQDNGGTLNGGVDLDQSANTVDINVNAVNDAPVNSVPLATQNVNEEATLTFSTVNGNAITISDIDVGSGNETVTLSVTSGILALASHAGLVSFSDNAAAITLTGTIANIDNALNGLTYTGNLDFHGNDTLVVNTNDNGNTGAGGPKTDSDNISITVHDVADTPSVTNATTNEDTQSASGLVVSRNATDSTDVAFFKITGITHGTLFQNDGITAINNGDFITFGQANAGLKFTPAADFFGNGSFNVQASTSNTNAGLGGSLATATITVDPVADTPSVTNATTNEDVQSTAGLVVSHNPVDGAEVGFVKITGITHGTLFQNDGVTAINDGDFITFGQANAGLKFTPTADFFGNGSFDVQASTSNADAGLGGSVQTATITVNPVADTPSVTNATTNEDTQSASGLVVSHNPVDGAEVGFVKITGITNGTLFQNDGTTAINNGDFITFGQANAGLKFTPAADFFGNGSFSVQASTSNTDAGLGGSVQTATITVDPVNDAPTLTAHDRDPVYAPGGVQLFDSTSVSVGPANESTQNIKQLVLTVSNVDGTGTTDHLSIDGTDVFLTDGNTAVGATHGVDISVTLLAGTATVTISKAAGDIPAADVASIVNGLTYTNDAVGGGETPRHVTLTSIQDDGGGTAPNVDTSALSIDSTVTFNLPPAITSDGAGATATKSIAENTTAVTTVTATDPDSGPSPIAFSIVPGDDGGKFSIDATGHLAFLSAPNFENPTDVGDTAGNNTYVVTVRASDGASFDDQTITVTVTDVNEAPVITSNGGGDTASINVNENSTTVTTVTATDQDVPAQTLTYSLVTGAGSPDQAKFTIDAAGHLSFITAPNFEVPTDANTDNDYVVQVKVTDNGVNPANLSDIQTITVHVQDVNEAPDTAAVTVAGNEDPTGPAYIPITITGTDVDAGDHVASFHITNVPNTGTQGTLYSDIGLTTQVTNGADVTATANSATLYFVPNANFNTHAGAVTFNAAATDTHSLTDATPATETINVTAVNDAPVNTAPANSDLGTAFSNTNFAVSGFSVADVDAGDSVPGDIHVTLGATHGNVSVTLNGTTVASGTNGSHSVTLDGTVAQVNAALASLVYHSDDGYTGSDTLTMHTDDLGHTGSGGAKTADASVDIGIVPQVFVIDNTPAGAGNNGSLTDPFNSIASFNTNANDGAGDYIYVNAGTYSEADGINLLGSEHLYGQGQTLTFTNPVTGQIVTIGTGSAGNTPVISVTGANQHGIDLGADDQVTGLNVQTTLGNQIGIHDSGASVGTTTGLTVSDVDVTGAGQAVNIAHGGLLNVAIDTLTSTGSTGNGIHLGTNSGGTALTGSFSAGTGANAAGSSISGSTGTAFLVGDGLGSASTGGTASINFGGAVSANNAGLIDIQDHATGAVTLSGTLTHTGTGAGIVMDDNSSNFTYSGSSNSLNTGASTAINITDQSGGTVAFSSPLNIDTTSGAGINIAGTNTGATFNFTGGSDTIDTTGGTGFSAAGGGTVSVTGSGNTISSGAGTALNLNGITVGGSGITFDSATTSGAATGISINAVTGGAINVNGGSIAGATTRGVDIAAAANDITIASTISSTGGHSVEVTSSGKAGGNAISFSGAITDTGGGINLDNNDQGGVATINFTGGLAINTSASNSTGFSATNGGTVNVTQNNTSIVNTINSGQGTALNIANTDIGASDVTFRSLASSGGTANGIILDHTGTAGGLHVTGTTTAGSGGTIASKTGADGSATQGSGIYLNNTSDVQLNHMQLNNFQNFGIRGFEVNGFTLANSTVNATSGTNGNSSGADEGSVSFRAADSAHNGLTGTASITNSTIANGLEDNFNVFNNSGSLNLTVSGSTFRDTSPGTPGNDGLLLQADNTANITGLITNSSFLRNFANGIQVINNGSGNVDVDVGQAGVAGSGGTFTDNFVGTNFDQNGAGTFNFNVLNAGFTTANYAALFGAGSAGSQINVNRGGSTSPVARGLFTGNIDNNTINNADSGTGAGVEVSVNGTGTGSNTTTVKIDGNNISHVANFGIHVDAGDGNGIVNATITNNTVSTTTSAALQAIRVDGGLTSSQAGAPGTPDNGTLNFDIHGNSLSTDPLAGLTDIRVRQRFNYTDKIEGYAGGATDDAAVQAYLASLNTHIGGGPATVAADHNNTGFGTIVAVTEPPAPLLAAAGGVQAISPTPGVTSLSQAELDSVKAAAIAQWATAGASGAQLAALAALTLTVADLAGDRVADHTPGHIVVDVNAAGHGWFVDPTPGDNSEFTHAVNAAGTDLLTDPTNAAAGHLDLVTAVSHEMGHELGLDDSTSAAEVNDLMHISLVDGERRLPDATDVAQTGEADIPQVAQAPAGTPVLAGNAANNTIDAGHGGNILFGGAGADNFVFGPSIQLTAPTPAQITHVADYHAAEGDTFDFSALTSAFHNSGVNDSLVVRAVEDASGKFATLQVDHIDPMGLPSAPNWVNVAQLDGAHAGDSVNVLIDSHSSVHLAQIHVDLLV